MAVQILVNQAGKPAGVAGRAREDLATGTAVSLSLEGGPFTSVFWSVRHRPIDLATFTRATALLTAPTSSTTLLTPIDKAGTYFVEVAVDSGNGLGAGAEDVAAVSFYAGPTLSTVIGELPIRVPAFGEGLQHNVPDALDASGNPEGWSRTLYKWFAYFERRYRTDSRASGRVTLTGAGATLVRGHNIASVVRAGVGLVDVTFTRPMTNANYAVLGGLRGSTAGSVVFTNEVNSGFRALRFNNGASLADESFNFAVLLPEAP